MIEKLFKGKRKDNNEWIVSNSILQTNCGGIHLWSQGDWVEVIPKTVGQFIGLIDKNDTKIFEGDIVKWVIDEKEVNERERIYDEGIDKVIYEASSFELNKERCLLCCFDNNKVFILEVIGNIHDNPEILNDKKYNDITLRCEYETIHRPNCGFEFIEE